MTSNEPHDEANPRSPTAWEPAPTIVPAAPGVSRRYGATAGLILALAIVIVAVASSPFWASGVAALLPWARQAPASSGNNEAVRALQNRLDADEATLKEQAAKLSRLGGIELAVKDQAKRLAALDARPATPPPAPTPATPAPPAQSSESATAIAALRDQVAKLTTGAATTVDRLAKLETQVEHGDTADRADRAFLLALANLRVAVEGSAPFAAELAAAQTLAGDKSTARQALTSLADAAKSGLPSLATLTERFDRRVAPAILRARGEAKNEDWWQQIKARLQRLVVIRRIAPGGAEPSDAAEAAVARADAALRAGDLSGAVASLDKLTGARAAAASSWLADARKRVKAETALATLWRTESARVAAAGAAKPGDKP